ncbi:MULTISPECIES: Prokaryotic metallothionein [unclassified Amycolatopsis]|uniref:Prokaryotic metallothionein n=1 Tax=unclassified Amycolatopsis TaxID=2618356 RepID=UPI000F770EA6|nr:Prokaryotic metallothionein [Amycolatopsis sp. WAC 01376]RSM57252.1 Prokaryotic metallothionein [Amycolatopsis sp. WAC 01376]
MATCEVCGNDYEKTFEIRTVEGAMHTFDSFECAIHQLAPICDHCGCRVVGHGIQVEDRFFCCAHCARESSVAGGDKARDAVAASH